jgi:hypothetical protein
MSSESSLSSVAAIAEADTEDDAGNNAAATTSAALTRHTASTTRASTKRLRFKAVVDRTQAIVTILGIMIGGLWALRLYYLQRQNHPHAKVAAQVTRVALTTDVILLQLKLTIDNTGDNLLTVANATARIQQILPLLGCAADKVCPAQEVNYALRNPGRISERFDWPIIAQRDQAWQQPLLIEPGENESLDFEFAIPAAVQVVRVYGFIPNADSSAAQSNEEGWQAISIVALPNLETVTELKQ